MRASEFIAENAGVCTTTSGAISPVEMPMGPMIRRNAGSFFAGKYTTDDATPNTPAEYKKYKRKK